MGDKKVCGDVCLCRCDWSSPQGEIYGRLTLGISPESNLLQPRFLEIVAFCQIRETLKRLLSASAESQKHCQLKTIVILTLGF